MIYEPKLTIDTHRFGRHLSYLANTVSPTMFSNVNSWGDVMAYFTEIEAGLYPSPGKIKHDIQG